jgi:hypothetical protein
VVDSAFSLLYRHIEVYATARLVVVEISYIMIRSRVAVPGSLLPAYPEALPYRTAVSRLVGPLCKNE